eukprot:CAMPEP_0172318094 /NCGR_PEP_ID=MMETSP1058-20130122/33825_1 /TAXON_ID=83371 /ORGANISM="Detonula confervacea, Strain CCMP 353" /LENGTH=400 /DNA_ID=CAMNT_0013032825 /DNA_START=208 /DNA_END=1413 /DNA_ORIENTATION=-
MSYRQRSSILVFLAAAVAGSILFASTNNRRSSITSLRTYSHVEDQSHRQLASLNLAQFTDPKSVTTRSDAPLEEHIAQETPPDGTPREQFAQVDPQSRRNCQIIYITGVEGATHHGFIPIIEALARNQIDPDTGRKFHVDSSPSALKAGLFGWFQKKKIKQWGFKITPEVDDPAFVQKVVAESCPDDGRKHVLIEWASFPSGHEDDPRSYRVHRQHEWLTMNPEEIANSEEALKHPTNMNAFYQSYSPYVDIKFIVLHRPFLETIASHRDWDGGPEIHSNIIRGFMLMLRRFLDTHLFDLVSGRRLWSLVCVERIMAKNYETEHDLKVARKHVMAYLSQFLDWPDGDCSQCFDDWRESSKDPMDVLGSENVEILTDHMKYLDGVWPPPGEEGIVEQQCGI